MRTLLSWWILFIGDRESFGILFGSFDRFKGVSFGKFLFQGFVSCSESRRAGFSDHEEMYRVRFVVLVYLFIIKRSLTEKIN